MTTVKRGAVEVDINLAHQCLGHISEAAIWHMAVRHGWKLKGTMSKSCAGCGYAKGQQKNIPKETAKCASVIGERLFIDLSGPFTISPRGNRYWCLIIDDATRKCWSRFIRAKSDIGTPLEEILIKLNGRGNKVQNLRCDGAGENRRYVADLCNKYGVNLERTAPNTPQQNGVVERAFAVLKAKATAMMEQAGFTLGT